MVMPYSYHGLKIGDIKITDTKIERRPNGDATIHGNCTVIPDDFGSDFIMDFVYTTKNLNEHSSKLLDYLKDLGWKQYQNICKAKNQEDTLLNFITNHSENIKVD